MLRMGPYIKLISDKTTNEEAYFALNRWDRCVAWYPFRASSNHTLHIHESCTCLRHEGRRQGLVIAVHHFQTIIPVFIARGLGVAPRMATLSHVNCASHLASPSIPDLLIATSYPPHPITLFRALPNVLSRPLQRLNHHLAAL